MSSLSWDDVEESRNYDEGTLFPPSEQFRNIYKTLKEQIANADDLLRVDSEPYGHGPREIAKNTIVYHGGELLDENQDKVFFVSTSRKAAEEYGPLSSYRVREDLPVVSILWDQLAANYGFDIDLSGYENWEDLDDDIDFGEYSDVMHQAEYNAHKVLTLAYRDKPLIIGSEQDEEYGLFPSTHYALKLRKHK